MAMSVTELQRWAKTLDKENSVAIDESGLCLVEITIDGTETGAYLEVGGVPNDEG